MSFDIWLSCFRDRKMAGFPRQIVEDAFGRFANHIASDQWQLRFDDGGEGSLFVHLLGEANDQVTALTVNRPPASPAFWAALIDVLRLTSSVLYWPGEGAVVADQSTITHLPQDFLQIVGTPIVTTDVEEIRDEIARA